VSAVGRSYTDDEIRAFSRMSWWEWEAKQGRPTRVGPRRNERGPWGMKPSAPRDYLNEPTDWLALPLDYLQRRD
jgi:hypothetical protein